MDYFLKLDGIGGESAVMPEEGSDLLIINNGDGSDFMEGATPASGGPVLAKQTEGGRHIYDEDTPSFETLSFNFTEIDFF